MKTALLVGAGSYVIGDSFGTGVVLPGLIQMARDGRLDRIILAVRSPRLASFWERTFHYKQMLDMDVAIEEVLISGPEDLPLDDNGDLVAFVVVPDSTHYAYCATLLRAGVPTWVVKPLTGDGEKSRQLARLSASTGIPLWVDYHKRFDPSNQKIRQYVLRGDWGKPVLYSVQYSQPASLPLGELRQWSKEVDVLQYIGCHYLDQVFFLFPEAVPTRVSATGLGRGLQSKGGPDFDLISANIDYQVNGAALRATLTVGWSDPSGGPSKSHQRVEVFFESGRIIADQKERGFEYWDERKSYQANPYFFDILPETIDGRWRATGYGVESIRNFLERLGENSLVAGHSMPLATSVFRTDVLLDVARQSLAASGQWVTCTPDAFFLT